MKLKVKRSPNCHFQMALVTTTKQLCLLLLSHFFPPRSVQDLGIMKQRGSTGFPAPGRSLGSCFPAFPSQGLRRVMAGGEEKQQICGASREEGVSWDTLHDGAVCSRGHSVHRNSSQSPPVQNHFVVFPPHRSFRNFWI